MDTQQATFRRPVRKYLTRDGEHVEIEMPRVRSLQPHGEDYTMVEMEDGGRAVVVCPYETISAQLSAAL